MKTIWNKRRMGRGMLNDRWRTRGISAGVRWVEGARCVRVRGELVRAGFASLMLAHKAILPRVLLKIKNSEVRHDGTFHCS